MNAFFPYLAENSCILFLLYFILLLKPSVVFETVLVLCWFSWSSISFLQILGSDLIWKKTIQGSMLLICIMNRLHKWATFERKQNKHSKEQDGRGISLRLCLHVDLPKKQKHGYLEFCQILIFRVLWLFCKHILN